MDSIINFNNSRILNNCSNLCYNNSAIHLLYSIVEFRELVYNTDSITYSNINPVKGIAPKYDINKSFYRLKYLFYLLNKDLVSNTYVKYTVNDVNVVCKRSSDGSNNNSFYNEIYKGLINDVITLYNNQNGTIDIDEINRLDTCSYSKVTLEFYLSVFNDLTNKLFSYDVQLNQCIYIVRYSNKTAEMSNNIQLNKYIIIQDFSTSPLYKNTIEIKGIRYSKIGLLVGYKTHVGAGGHFWFLIKNNSTNDYTEINDLYSINNSSKFDELNQSIDAGLYVREGEKYVDAFPIKNQICNLVEVSNKINTNSINNLDSLNSKVLKKIIKNKLK
jgi:hypothetical protein